jgi:hypothetical protein
VLFSSADIAGYVNDAFEPAWVSVRPVPIVTIDFGNGHKVTRTLSGNIATSVCDADGRVLDILPGIYTHDEYQKQLEQFRLLHAYVSRIYGSKPDDTLKAYHTRQAERLKAEQPADVLVLDIRAFVSKARIENPVKLLAAADAAKVPKVEPTAPRAPNAPTDTGAGVAGWKELTEDTRINETLRRRQVHEKLAATGPVPPPELVKWLYKDVLHADLDDPMLGLGEVLNRNYPFADEERKPAAP